jgi:hypothetical protein
MITNDMANITVCIKTFMRPDILNKTLQSIRDKYKDITILVADDSKKEYIKIDNMELADRYYHLKYNSGTSYGRNYLLSQVETKYIIFIDDDHVFTQQTDIEVILYILQRYNLDMVGFKSKKKSAPSKLIRLKRKKILYRVLNVYMGVYNGCPLYDLIPQSFITTKEFSNKNRWHTILRFNEHLPFFYQMLDKNVKISFINSVKTKNENKNDPDIYKRLKKQNEDYVKKFKIQEKYLDFLKPKTIRQNNEKNLLNNINTDSDIDKIFKKIANAY